MATQRIVIADKATLDNVDTNVSSVKQTVENTATTVNAVNTNTAATKTKVDSMDSKIDTVDSVVDGIANDTTAIKSRGGIKYNSSTSKPQVYDPSNNTWNDLEIGGGGGGASPTLVVVNKNATMNNKDVTVKSTDNLFNQTKNMSTNNYLIFELPWLGDYVVSYLGNLGETITLNINVPSVGGVTVEASISYPTFANATDAQISQMLSLHYNDELNISDIWAVGDTRNINISAMSATGVGESHSAQTRQITILDFDHDDLQTAINGHTKAALTIQLVDCLNTNGYMNSSDTNVGGWTNSARRTWCNNVFYNALPSGWKSMVKTVKKKTSAGNQSSTINTDNDKIFLLSEIEIFNTTTYSKAGEGTQYEYYQTTANRIKKVNGSANYWWERSPYGSNSTIFCLVYSDGSASYYYASYTNGLAPALCI